METISIEAKGRTYSIEVYPEMQADLPPNWQIIYNDWLGGFRTGSYGTEEAAIRLVMIFTNAKSSIRALNPTRWAAYGFERDELEAFVRAGLTIMEELWREPEEEPEQVEGGAAGKSRPAKK